MDEDTQVMDQELMDDYDAEDEVQEVEEAQEPESSVEDKPKPNYQGAFKSERARYKKVKEENDQLRAILLDRLAAESRQPKAQEVDPLDEVLNDLDDVDPRMVKALKAIAEKANQPGKSEDLIGVQVELLKDKYPGISDHKAEISTLVKRLGVTAEEAYLMKHGNELLRMSREDLLREHDIRSAAHKSAAGITAAGNAQQTPPKKAIKTNLTPRDEQYLQSRGISTQQYARITNNTGGTGGMSISDLQKVFGGAKKG